MKNNPCVKSICLVAFFILSLTTIAMADYLTADPQPAEMVTKYEVKLNTEIFPVEAKAVEGNQVELFYNIDHLKVGRYSAFARAGNDADEWSEWCEEYIFYRGVPTPQNIGLYCVTEEPKRLSQDGFSVYHVSSYQSGEENPYSGAKAIDGSINSEWHSGYVGDGEAPFPHEIQIDLGRTYTVSGFWQQSRQGSNLNCMILSYKFYVSVDGTDWVEVVSGKFPDSQEEHFVSFAPCKVRYVSLVSLSSTNGSSCTTVAELNVLGY